VSSLLSLILAWSEPAWIGVQMEFLS